jgi:hypothetical protein
LGAFENCKAGVRETFVRGVNHEGMGFRVGAEKDSGQNFSRVLLLAVTEQLEACAHCANEWAVENSHSVSEYKEKIKDTQNEHVYDSTCTSHPIIIPILILLAFCSDLPLRHEIIALAIRRCY